MLSTGIAGNGVVKISKGFVFSSGARSIARLGKKESAESAERASDLYSCGRFRVLSLSNIKGHYRIQYGFGRPAPDAWSGICSIDQQSVRSFN